MSEISKYQPNDLALVLPKGFVDLTTPIAMLMEQMAKVKSNPAQEIPVAKAQCEIVDRLINISKVQIQQGSTVMDMIRFRESNKNNY